MVWVRPLASLASTTLFPGRFAHHDLDVIYMYIGGARGRTIVPAQTLPQR